MKIFGRELFNFKRKEPEEMYDFAQHGLAQKYYGEAVDLVEPMESPVQFGTRKGKNKRERKPKILQVTAKGIYMMGSLNDNNFVIKVDPDYVDQMVRNAEKKLKLYPKEKKGKDARMFYEDGAVRFGRNEVISIIERLKNRNKINEFKKILDKYPHTTTSLIAGIVKANSNLMCGKAEEFIPDFPDEAIDAMDEYQKMCQKLCGKKTHFYVIAEKNDFGEKNRRRDPILLAQSPFGFFWQILGAWDEEMMYLGDL